LLELGILAFAALKLAARAISRFLLAVICAALGLFTAFGAAGCAIAALWIALAPHVGGAVAAIWSAFVLLLMTGALVLASKRG
jgi:hypothetical protein